MKQFSNTIINILLHHNTINYTIAAIMKNIYNNIAVIILAGGQSQRAETIKGLREIGSDYWIDLQIKFYQQLGIDNIFIGLGFDYQEYLDKSILIKQNNYAINPNPENGSFSTLQAVLRSIPKIEIQQLIIMYIDHAIPNISTIEKLIGSNHCDVIKPLYKKKSGHPIVISQKLGKQLINKTNSSQLNNEIKKLNLKQINWIDVNDKNILENFNTQDKWENFKTKFLNNAN